MSGEPRSKSFLFRDSATRGLLALLYTENDEKFVCMNGAIIPFDRLREFVVTKEMNGGIACGTAEGVCYFIPNSSMGLLSQAMIEIR